MLTVFVLVSTITLFNLTVVSFTLPFSQSRVHWLVLRNLHSSNQFSEYQDIPIWLLTNCDRLKYLSPTEVQKKSLKKIFDGKDVIVQSPTGSGKTLLFALPILSKLNWKRRAIQAVIVEPTRELALQVVDVLEELSRDSPKKLNIMTVLEGSNKRESAWGLSNPPHIVVGNPQSLQPLVDKGQLQLGSVAFIVLDEVDTCLRNKQTSKELHTLLTRHLSNTYNSEKLEEQYEADRIMNTLNYHDKTRDFVRPEIFRSHRQAILCSATIPQRQYFAQTCQQNGWTETEPELILMEDTVPPQIEHYYVGCENDIPSRVKLLSDVVMKELRKALTTPSNSSTGNSSGSPFQAIVFCGSEEHLQTCFSVLAKQINELRASNTTVPVGNVKYLSESTMFLHERSKTLDAFRKGDCSVLVCSTNVVTRGIDIPSTTHIFQLYLPITAELYLHQAGRTGRLDRPGTVITLVHPREVKIVLSKYQNEMDIEFTKLEM